MTRTRPLLMLILMVVTALAVASCNRKQITEEAVADTQPVAEENYFADADTTPTPEVEMPPIEPKAATAPRVVKKEPVKEEVLYISGHGANGRVWGHITMKGDKGYGSVTDEHENALTVTCTRQGEELICYDQNSRQYIFRL